MFDRSFYAMQWRLGLQDLSREPQSPISVKPTHSKQLYIYADPIYDLHSSIYHGFDKGQPWALEDT